MKHPGRKNKDLSRRDFIKRNAVGAGTLILEKAPKKHEGGNSKVSGNIWWTPANPDDAVKYITALCYGLTDPDSIRALARGMFENNAWLEKMGIKPKPLGLFQPEYPELPGSRTVRTYFNARGTFGGNLYFPLRKQVSDRSIPVMYETGANTLVQNEKREIMGVKAASNGKTLAIKLTFDTLKLEMALFFYSINSGGCI